MPQPPNVDGLPGWLQVLITLVFGAVTLIVAMRGYRAPAREENGNGVFTDAAHRHLAESIHHLNGSIVSLQRSIEDHTHFERQSAELQRELNQRLRELKERLDRNPGM